MRYYLHMTNRTKKIIVDLGMTIFIILSFVRWDGNPTFHIIVGIACTIFFILHICLHRKWLMTQTRKVVQGKARAKVARLYLVDALLLVIWSISVITGIFAILPYLAEPGGASWLGSAHGMTARLGAVLAVIHLFQHLKQIRSYFRRSAKTS